MSVGWCTAGAEIAVATPGRMMDLIRMKACTTLRITYLVLDEADRMFDMGFGEQVGGCCMAGFCGNKILCAFPERPR